MDGSTLVNKTISLPLEWIYQIQVFVKNGEDSSFSSVVRKAVHEYGMKNDIGLKADSYTKFFG